MTEAQLTNTKRSSLVDWDPTFEQAIESINRLLHSDEVNDDDLMDAEILKAYLVDVKNGLHIRPCRKQESPV
jgi:hypothetical protein